MALASAPATPERAALPPSIRRSFTAPIKSSISAVPIAEGPVDGAETLYAHTACKIISFSHSSSAGRRHSSVSNGRAEFQEESTGTLPWASATERTIAAGPLRIYRVLGSVAFLNSGGTLHPILAKSQCWCVDGESKFVLRIRPNTYYRIELPCRTSMDELKVGEFKTVLAKVLQYEVTPCPFKRGFTVDLPDLPTTPVQKRPWRPKTKLEITPEKTVEEFEKFDFGLESPRSRSPRVGKDIVDGTMKPTKKAPGNDLVLSREGSNSESDNEHDIEAVDDTESSAGDEVGTFQEDDMDLKTPTRPKSLTAGRAVTAPPHLTIRTKSSSNIAADELPKSELKEESPSLSSSVDSFHSFHSPISPLAPSPKFPTFESPPPECSPGIDMPRARPHKRDPSDITVTADASEFWDLTSIRSSSQATYHSPPDLPGTPPLIDDAASDDETWPEAVTPSPTKELRRRRFRSTVRGQSPPPPSVNLYSPYSPRAHMSGHHLTTAILQRTCSLLLGPPVQLVALMLRIAAKIAKGAFRGSSFGFGEGGQKIPCSWDFSDGSDDNDDEDDYGVQLSRPTSKTQGPKEIAGSWEID